MAEVEQSWSRLVSAALLGTERKPFAAEADAGAGSAAALLERIEAGNGEKALLDAATVVALYRQAGAMPMLDETEPPAPAPQETLPYVSANALALLQQVVNMQPSEMRDLWIAAAAKAGVVVPPDRLVALLTAAIDTPDKPSLLAVIGERGRWLAAQHEGWSALLGAGTDEESWDNTWLTGTRDVRRELIKAVRRADPKRAREMIEASWGDERADDRAFFVGVLRINLSMEDEPFLERALDDRGKEVRKNAADMLGTLPASRLVARMIERVTPALNLQEGKRKGIMGALGGRKQELVVDLPAKLTPEMIRDGVEKSDASRVLGDRAWWLLQMLALVPPSTWTRRWGVSPKALLDAVADSDWKDVMLRGWTQAATQFEDRAWSDALIELIDPLEPSNGLGYGWISLIGQLPQDRWEAWIMQRIQSDKQALIGSRPAATALTHQRRKWSPALSRLFLNNLRRLLAMEDPGPIYQLRGSMNDIALDISTDVLREVEERWPEQTQHWGYWGAGIAEMVTILRLRVEIEKEFAR